MPAEDPDQLIDHVGHRIGELRARAGRTQAEVAEALGTTLSNYQRIEHGLQNLTLRTMAKIANAIRVKVGDFFIESEAPRHKRGRPKKKVE